ncbi:MAG: efflux RND transporter periplasmic adaptor subunit [Deltaproteobacteria bacterium]|jgi:cobalt-zinc-cadmium efflux system membrane fusion protein
MRLSRTAILLGILVAACHDHDHGDQGHSHGGGGGHEHPHEGEGNGHDEGHGHGHDAPEDDRPTVVVTLYQSDLELFMEYPALVQGHSSKLIAHFTVTSNPNAFAAVTEGRVTVKLGAETFVAEAPARAGVFLPIVTPTTPGKKPFSLTLEGRQATGTIDLGEVTVFPSAEAAKQGIVEEEDSEPTISFLKESQWKTDYATVLVEPRVMRGGVYANGKLKPVPGKSAELSAPVRGRLVTPGPVPHVGMKVKAGQVLLQVAPLGAAVVEDPATIEFAVEEARTELAHAERERERIRALVEAKALPAKRLHEAESSLKVAEARVRAAGKRASTLRSAQRGGAVASRFALTSPIDGEIASADITPGAIVEAGERLISIVDTDHLWLEARVYEDDAVTVRDAPGAAFTVSGLDRAFETESLHGERIAVGPVVDEISRTVPLIFSIDNPDRLLKPGMFAKVTVYSGDTVKGLAIPEAAIVDDGGHPSVFLMQDGETFVRRRVRPGVRSGGFVQILSSLEPGDRVVSRGAYEIKLASSAGSTPAHGHAH